MAAADARAHAFDDELCPVHRPATSCVARGSQVSGLDVRDWGLAEPERSWGTAGEEDSPGRGVSTPERADLLVLSDDAARYALLSIVGTLQHVQNLYDERHKH